MSYWDRLDYLNLDSLYNRGTKSDLLMTYKILNGQVDVESSAFFSKQVIETVTRGNDAKLCKTKVYSARDGNYISNRVINLWNSLPNHVVSVSSVGAFKRKLQNLRLPLFIT